MCKRTAVVRGECTTSCTGRWRGQLRAVMVPTFVRPRKSPPNVIRGRHLHSAHHFCARRVEFSTEHRFVRFDGAIFTLRHRSSRRRSVATVTKRTGKPLARIGLRVPVELVALQHAVSTAPITIVMPFYPFSTKAGPACLHSRSAGWVCLETHGAGRNSKPRSARMGHGNCTEPEPEPLDPCAFRDSSASSVAAVTPRRSRLHALVASRDDVPPRAFPCPGASPHVPRSPGRESARAPPRLGRSPAPVRRTGSSSPSTTAPPAPPRARAACPSPRRARCASPPVK